MEIVEQYGLEQFLIPMSMDEKFNSGNSTAIWAMGELQIICRVYKMQRLLSCSVCGQTFHVTLFCKAEDLNSLQKFLFTTGSFKESLQSTQDAKATQLLNVWQTFHVTFCLQG